VEYIEGYDTVLFICKNPEGTSELKDWLKGVSKVKADESSKRRIHEIPVVYDGPDLEEVARRVGLTAEEVIEIHSASVYTVRMMGFSPGFPYLDGLDERLHLPRKDSPRNRIEPGAVAIGGSHAGIYSVASPGGWHLLGRTNVKFFDASAAKGHAPDRAEVFLLSPGDELRFKVIQNTK
jgi:KipI family sensor histidine kinase inhibitor